MTDLPDSFTFCVDGRARPKERPRLGRRGRVFTPKRTLEYERTVATVAQCVMPEGWPLDCEYAVTLEYAFKPGAVPDVDNCVKATCDSLNGVCWHDDRQVVEIHAKRIVSRYEHALITVTRVSEPKPQPKKRERKPRPAAKPAKRKPRKRARKG